MSKTKAADLLGDIPSKAKTTEKPKIKLPTIGTIVNFHAVIDNESVIRPAIVVGSNSGTGTLHLNVFMDGHMVFQPRCVHGTDNLCWSRMSLN